MTMEKKSDKVRRLVAAGDYRAALSIAKGFRIGISREDVSTMTRGFECMAHPGFYSQLGMDEAYEIDQAIKTVKKLYGSERKGENNGERYKAKRKADESAGDRKSEGQETQGGGETIPKETAAVRPVSNGGNGGCNHAGRCGACIDADPAFDVRRTDMEMRTLEERDRILESLWDGLADIPMDPDTEEMEEQYLHFPAGTHREEIWRWFDERYSKGVAHLLYRDGVDRTDDVAEYIHHKGMCEDCDSSFCAYNVFGVCRFPMVGGRRPKLSEDGCADYVYMEVELCKEEPLMK